MSVGHINCPEQCHAKDLRGRPLRVELNRAAFVAHNSTTYTLQTGRVVECGSRCEASIKMNGVDWCKPEFMPSTYILWCLHPFIPLSTLQDGWQHH